MSTCADHASCDVPGGPTVLASKLLYWSGPYKSCCNVDTAQRTPFGGLMAIIQKTVSAQNCLHKTPGN